MKFFENSFFAIKLACTDVKTNYWEIMRKIKTLPGAKGELLEVLALCLMEPGESYFFFEVIDFDLCQDLSNLGGKRVGYLAEVKSKSITIDGWEEIWNAKVLSLTELDVESKYKKNLFFIQEIKHSLKCIDDFFTENFFKRDRIYWGLTKRDPTWQHTSDYKMKKFSPLKKFEKWSDVLTARHSVLSFSDNKINEIELKDFLHDCLLKRPDEHLQYGSVGGFESINTYLAIRGINGVKDGLYKIDTKSNSLVFFRKFESFNLLENFLFLSDDLSIASIFLFFSISFDEMREKCGQRSTRFSLLTLGGVLQQAHLSATAHGLSYRIIGGFDEFQCSKILEIGGSEYLACAAILGK